MAPVLVITDIGCYLTEGKQGTNKFQSTASEVD